MTKGSILEQTPIKWPPEKQWLLEHWSLHSQHAILFFLGWYLHILKKTKQNRTDDATVFLGHNTFFKHTHNTIHSFLIGGYLIFWHPHVRHNVNHPSTIVVITWPHTLLYTYYIPVAMRKGRAGAKRGGRRRRKWRLNQVHGLVSPVVWL